MDFFCKKLDLQFFADGAGGEGGGQGEAAADAGAQNDTVETQTDNEAVDLDREYDELINGKFKDIHEKRFNSEFDKRFKDYKKKERAANEAAPILKVLSERYGIDKKDAAGLLDAVRYDKLYVREKANELGMDDDEFIEHDKMKRKADSYDQLMEAERKRAEFDEKMAEWQRQGETLKAQFPSFDLQAEMDGNKDFFDMIARGVPVRNAFLAIHHDDIVSGTVQYAVNRTEENVSRRVAQQKSRPAENGMSSQASASSKLDVNSLTGEQIRDLMRRAENGEKITLK